MEQFFLKALPSQLSFHWALIMGNIYHGDKCLAGQYFFIFPEEIIQLLAQLCSWPFHPSGTRPSLEGWKEKFHSLGCSQACSLYSWCGFRIWFGNNRSYIPQEDEQTGDSKLWEGKGGWNSSKKVFLGKIQPCRCFKTLSSTWTLQHNLGHLNLQGISHVNPKIKENKLWTYQRRKRRRDGMIKIKKQLKGRRIQECCKRKEDFTSIYSFPQV